MFPTSHTRLIQETQEEKARYRLSHASWVSTDSTVKIDKITYSFRYKVKKVKFQPGVYSIYDHKQNSFLDDSGSQLKMQELVEALNSKKDGLLILKPAGWVIMKRLGVAGTYSPATMSYLINVPHELAGTVPAVVERDLNDGMLCSQAESEWPRRGEHDTPTFKVVWKSPIKIFKCEETHGINFEPMDLSNLVDIKALDIPVIL